MGLTERIIKWERGTGTKKYKVTIKGNGKTRTLQFGAKAFEHFKDSTPLKLYKNKDHGDSKRRQNYFTRHSNEKTKAKALFKEMKQSGGKYTPKILSHKFLW
jgi:hypothetical protein